MRRLALIGCAQGWQDAPSDCECWGISHIVLMRDVDCLFHMHDLNWDFSQWLAHCHRWQGHIIGPNGLKIKARNNLERIEKVKARVNELGIPVYSTTECPEVATNVAYPLELMCVTFGTRLFTCTADYAVAKAIFDGYNQIDLYGFNMGTRTEYGYQLPGFSYWLGRAAQADIGVTVHGESMVLRSPNGLMYGYDVPQERRKGKRAGDRHAREI